VRSASAAELDTARQCLHHTSVLELAPEERVRDAEREAAQASPRGAVHPLRHH
jgi:hypothetical protein